MKKFTTAIIGLSLLAGSALSAQDNFTSFYPVENDDTPSYLLSDKHDSKAYQTLAKVSSNDNVFASFYPVENNDSPSYLNYNNQTTSVNGNTIAQSGITHCTLASFYPEENLDTRIQSSC
jgi:hypothetical protein